MADISNSDDTIDSRDINERIEELEGERGDLDDLDELRQDVEDAQEAYNALLDDPEASESDREDAADTLAGARKDLREAEAWEENNPDDAEELAALIAFRDEMKGYCSDWDSGETLIRDSYFEDYARELAEDIGAIPDDAKWPCNCIDWEKAARELQMDYTSAEFDGVTYWAR